MNDLIETKFGPGINSLKNEMRRNKNETFGLQKTTDLQKEFGDNPLERASGHLRKTQAEEPLNVEIPVSNNEIKEWYLTEDIKGIGEKPPYFKDQTFKYLAGQAKAWIPAQQKITELTNKLKKYGEIPDELEEYKADLPEEIYNDKFVKDLLSNELPNLRKAAKEANISKKSFQKVIEYFGQYLKLNKDREEEEMKGYAREELSKIDATPSEAKRKLNELKNWVTQLYPDINMEQLRSVLNSSAAYYVLDHIRNRGSSSLPKAPTEITKEQLSRSQYADYLRKRLADPRNKRDKEFSRETNALYRQFYINGVQIS